MHVSQRVFCCFIVGHKFLIFPTPFEKRKKILTINNSYYQKEPTLMSHPSHFSLPTSLSHIAMLPLLVSVIISSSFSSAWEVVPNLPKCGEMIRHVQSNTANTDLFFTKRHTATRQVYFFSACHLSLATIWLGETYIYGRPAR